MTITKSELIERAIHLLSKKCPTINKDDIIIAAAPGRVNLIGEHIDYCDGFVMPFAIDKMIIIAAVPIVSVDDDDNTKTGTFITDDTKQSINDITIPLDDINKLKPISTGSWSNYVTGVVAGCLHVGLVPTNSFIAVIVSSVPAGAGLSSSAALECAVATILEGLCASSSSTNTNQNQKVLLSKTEKALLCQKAEHEYANVPCGIMDQFASIYGEENYLIYIDCQSCTVSTLVPFTNSNLVLIVANTCVSHELVDGGYSLRRKHTEDALQILNKSSWRTVTKNDVQSNWELLGDPINKRSRHVVTEIQRTQDAVLALNNNDYSKLGQLMYESHYSLKDDFNVSCIELDIMVDIAQNIIGSQGGVIGSRMTGGGFGGSTVTLCESQYATNIINIMTTEYTKRTGIVPSIFITKPSQGAHLVTDWNKSL